MYEAALQWFDLPAIGVVRIAGSRAWEMVLRAGEFFGEGDLRSGILLLDNGALGGFAYAGRTADGAVVLTEEVDTLKRCLWRDEEGPRALVTVASLPVSTVQGGRAWALQDHDVVDYGDQVWLRHSRSPEGGWDVVGVKGVQPQGRREDLLALSLEAGVPVYGWDAHRFEDPGPWLGGPGNLVWAGVVLDREASPARLLGPGDEPAGRLVRVSWSLRLNQWIGGALLEPEWAVEGTRLWGPEGPVEVRLFPLVRTSQD